MQKITFWLLSLPACKGACELRVSEGEEQAGVLLEFVLCLFAANGAMIILLVSSTKMQPKQLPNSSGFLVLEVRELDH